MSSARPTNLIMEGDQLMILLLHKCQLIYLSAIISYISIKLNIKLISNYVMMHQSASTEFLGRTDNETFIINKEYL